MVGASVVSVCAVGGGRYSVVGAWVVGTGAWVVGTSAVGALVVGATVVGLGRYPI